MSKGRVADHEDKTEMGARFTKPFSHCQEYVFILNQMEEALEGFEERSDMIRHILKIIIVVIPLAIEWLRFTSSTARGTGSILDQGTKIHMPRGMTNSVIIIIMMAK